MPKATAPEGPAERIAALDWTSLEQALVEQRYCRTGPLLSPEECDALRSLFADDALFRKRVDMARHNYGRGRYAYFAEPLPDMVADLRAALYARLSPIANRMMALLGDDRRFPGRLDAYRRRCAAAGQSRPTPLLLQYRTGDFNNLHRDIYGGEFFPLQATALLSRPGRDFDGGEFLLVENRARQQSRGMVVPLQHGEIVVFPGDLWPAPGRRGPVRARLRHGVSRLTAGDRMALGLIFHDAA